MLQKRQNGGGDVVVTFRLPVEVRGDSVCVAGDFNDWSTEANPMTHDDEGFVAVISLAPGRAYRFRYLVDGTRWENDWAADAYVPNEFGGDDSLVDLTTFDGTSTVAEPVAESDEPAAKRGSRTAKKAEPAAKKAEPAAKKRARTTRKRTAT